MEYFEDQNLSWTPKLGEKGCFAKISICSVITSAIRLRYRHVERCRYEASLARRRYLKVDPDKRYVAEVLEAEWNEKLRALD